MIGRLALAAILLLSGCGLRPVYTGGTDSLASRTLSEIAVAPIPDRAGFLVRKAVQARLGDPAASARFRLVIELDDAIEGFGIRGDDSITRERRTLRARYRLMSSDGARTYLDATARSDAGIDVVRSSDYAVVAAETSALERLSTELAQQIAARVALLVRTSPDFAEPVK
jgi:LPS-assembly lipoprotein